MPLRNLNTSPSRQEAGLTTPGGYDCREDFCHSTAPSKNIWKKYELVPSPLTSPPWGLVPGAGDPGPGIGPLRPGLEGAPETKQNPGATRKVGAGTMSPSSAGTACGVASRPENGWRERWVTHGNLLKASATPDCTPGLEACNPAPAAPSPLGEPETQACSGSQSPGDSENEEIDVVTVEKRQFLGIRKPVTVTVQADPLDPCMKHFHTSHHQQPHNYAARFPLESCSQEEAPERGPQEEALEKDAAGEKENEEDEEIVRPSPAESEATQSCHPKNHNFLERKRRNDLRSRFLALRDQVPTLAMCCSKARKVAILIKALEYLQALVVAEKWMAMEKRQLRCQQQQLQKRIACVSGY
nr:protein L-Myc-like [Saimiri boliviensis boliviensis]